MDLMSVAIRFTTEGQADVRSQMAAVRSEAKGTAGGIADDTKKATNEFGNLAKAVNHVGNEFGLGLNRGLVNAAKGLNESAEAAVAYIVKMKAAAGATSLLATAQTVAAAAGRALSGVLAAFGGPIGVALIGGLLLLEKVTSGLAESAQKAADAYDEVHKNTQKVYDQLVAQNIGWANVARSITNATNALDAYRRGGQPALDREKQWQEAIGRTRAQYEALVPSAKKLSDAELMLDATFAQMFARQMQAVKLEGKLTDIMGGSKIAEDAKKADLEMKRALFAQSNTNREFFQAQIAMRVKAGEDEVEVIRAFNAAKRAEQAKEDAAGLAAFNAYTAESDRLLEAAFIARQQRIEQQNQQIAGTLVGGLEAAIDAATSGGNPLAALGASVLAGFGNILIQMGTTALAAAPFIAAIRAALDGLSGGALAAAGLGLIGVGSLLKLGAGALGGRGGGGGGGGGGYAGGFGQGSGLPYQDSYRRVILGETSTSTAAGLPQQSPVNVTVIGPNDPTAQRQIQELVRNANRRGS